MRGWRSALREKAEKCLKKHVNLFFFEFLALLHYNLCWIVVESGSHNNPTVVVQQKREEFQKNKFFSRHLSASSHSALRHPCKSKLPRKNLESYLFSGILKFNSSRQIPASMFFFAPLKRAKKVREFRLSTV